MRGGLGLGVRLRRRAAAWASRCGTARRRVSSCGCVTARRSPRPHSLGHRVPVPATRSPITELRVDRVQTRARLAELRTVARAPAQPVRHRDAARRADRAAGRRARCRRWSSSAACGASASWSIISRPTACTTARRSARARRRDGGGAAGALHLSRPAARPARRPAADRRDGELPRLQDERPATGASRRTSAGPRSSRPGASGSRAAASTARRRRPRSSRCRRAACSRRRCSAATTRRRRST